MTDDATEPTAWEETTGRVVALAQRSGQLSNSSPTSAARIEPEAFARELTPALALVGGSGMTQQARREWLNAAYRAIGDVPADLFQRAVRDAMKHADHPSRIVPAVTRFIEAEREAERKAEVGRIRPVAFVPDKRTPVPHEETQAILKAAGINLSSEQRDPWSPKPVAGGTGKRGRMPTREDYIRMGVDPAVLDAPEQGQAAFDQLVVDLNPDHGPAWLDRIIFAHRSRRQAIEGDYAMLRRACDGLREIS